MKITLLRLSMVVISTLSFSILFGQISVSNYPKEIRCTVDELPLLERVLATSETGPVTTQINEQIFSGGCAGTMVRTYTFSDKFDNYASAEQYIYLSDNKAPLLVGIPADITLKLGDKIAPPPLVECVDNSHRLYLVYYSEAKTEVQIIRTWTCTDDCGNSSQAKQVITIEK